VPDVADIAVQRFDVVAVRIEQIRGVVARGVLAISGRAVGAKSRVDSSSVELVDLRLRPGRYVFAYRRECLGPHDPELHAVNCRYGFGPGVTLGPVVSRP